MADAIATLGLNVDANGAITSTNQLRDSLTKLDGSATKTQASISGLVAKFGAFVGVASVLHKFVQETVSAQNAQAQLEAAVKSTGGAAERSVSQLLDMSAALQKVSTYADDAIQGAQAMLLTFNQIKGDTFDQATVAVVDLATRMGGDLSAAALQVGKALQDPVTGLTALRRSGVSFTDAQQEVIKTLAETGQMVKAQEMILAELRLEFGGSAAAARDTLGGALAGLTNAFGDLFEVSKGGTGGVVAALNLLADKLDMIAKAAVAVGIIFGARFLAGAVERIAAIGMSFVTLRAETLAYAEEEVRTAAATKAASVARLAELEAEKAELRSLMALERQRLLLANQRVARAVPMQSLAPLGGAVATRDNAEVAFATKAQADSRKALNVMGERQVAVNGAIVASNGAVTASTNALTVAQKAQAGAMSMTATAGKALNAVYNAMGGGIGIAIGVILTTITIALNQAAKAKENARKRAEDYTTALNGLSPAALRAALATETLGLAMIQAQEANTGVAVDAKVKAVAAAKERIKVLDDMVKAYRGVAAASQNASVKEFTDGAKAAAEQLKVLNTQGKVAADAFKMANEKWVDGTGKMRDFADALAQGDAKALELRDAALLLATAQDKLSASAAGTKAAVKAANTAFKEQDELFRKIAQSTSSLLDEQLDKMNQVMTARNAANVNIADSIDKRREENKAIREQIAALLISEKAYRAVMLMQEQAAAVKAEQDKLPAGQQLSEKQVLAIRALVAENERLREVRGALQDLDNKDTTVATTHKWLDALTEVVGVVQLIASAFGDVGRQIAQAGGGVQSILGGLKAANSIKDSKGASVGFGKAMSGGAGIAGVVSGLGAAGAVVGGAMAIADAFDLFGKKAKENARIVREAANSLGEALASFRRQTALTAGSLAADIASMKESLGGQIDNLLKVAFGSKAVRADGTTGFDYINQETVNANRAKAAQYGVNTAMGSPFAKFADELQKLVDAVAERIRKAVPKLLSTLDAYYNSAFGNEGQTQLDQAKEQWIAFTQDISTAYNAGALTLEQYNTQLNRLNDAYTENVRKINEEIAAKARQAKEAERRSIFDMNNGALAFTNPRAARDAEMVERANRRMTDAVERNASATELLSIASFNAAEALNYLKEQAEADLRTSEGLVGRILGTMGDDRATQDYNTAASQRQEMADAIKDGMSDTNIKLLEFTQFAERSYITMTRAIEDGTKAINEHRNAAIKVSQDIIDAITADSAARIAQIDKEIGVIQTTAEMTARRYSEQIDAIREQAKAQEKAIDAQIESARSSLDAAQQTVSALEKVVSTNEKVYEALKSYGDSLKLGALSTLSPEGKLREARAQFEAMAAAAQSGDANAATNLPSAANALLEASRGYNASGEGFVADYNRVQGVVEAVKMQFGATLPIDQQTLLAAQQQVAQLQGTIDALESTKEAINDAAQAQIDVLEAAKSKAAEDAKTQIDKLEKLKDAIKTNAQAAIDREQKRIDEINERADAEIERLKEVEKAAHLQRLKGNENWDVFLNYLKGNGIQKIDTGIVNVQDKAAPEVDPQLDELKSMNATLDARLANVEELLTRAINVDAAGTREETGATYAVMEAVNVLIQETRAAAQAAAARTSTIQKR